MEKKEIVELKQFNDRLLRDPDEYFIRFDKLLPSGLTKDNTVLLYKIDNIGCISKIIARNPQAKYTIFGNKYVNDALRLIDIGVDITYIDSTTKFNDRRLIDYTAFDYSCYEWPPESKNPVDMLKIGLKVGTHLTISTRDESEVLASATIHDGRHVKLDGTGEVVSLDTMWKRAWRKGVHVKVGKHHHVNHYPSYIVVDDTGLSIRDYYDIYLKPFCVTKNR